MKSHNLKTVADRLEKLKEKHRQNRPDFDKIDDIVTKVKLPSLMLTPYFDLRGDKIEVMKNTPLCTGYMLFLNNSGSLGHIVHADDVSDPDYSTSIPHRREPIPPRLRGAHPEAVRRHVLKKLLAKNMI